MRIVTACLCVLGLTIVANSQEKGARVADTPPAAVLKARQLEVGVVPAVQANGATTTRSRVVAKGDVEIRLGQSIITADEAEIRYGAPGEPDDVELRGHVRLKAHLTVE